MKILFIGDIVSKPGRDIVKKLLPSLKREYNPDFTIANAENLSHGDGFSPKNISEMQEAGIDFFTSGNHVWGNKEGVKKLDDPNFPVIRPANFPAKETPGRGYQILELRGKKILVINLIGQVFMKKHYDSPFRVTDKILKDTAEENLSAIIVDFHAETTSEKYAFGYYMDGRVSAVIGTHTHVPTADARVFENGTAYITDAGMTGPFDSIIGVEKETIIKSFLTQMPVKHEPETSGKMVLSGVVIEVDVKNKKALNIIHVLKFL